MIFFFKKEKRMKCLESFKLNWEKQKRNCRRLFLVSKLTFFIIMKLSLIQLSLSAAENRKIIAMNLAEASLYDVKAEKQLKAGNNEQAAYYAILSQGYLRIASEAKIE